MNLKFDRFTGVILALVAALLIAAVVTVNLSGNEPTTLEYLDEDTPAAPVYNAYVAQQRGDRERMREQYSQRILTDEERTPDFPITRSTDRNARLRILDVITDESNPNVATVDYAIDRYYGGGGLFGNNSSTNQNSVTVVREDGAWKIDSWEFFY